MARRPAPPRKIGATGRAARHEWLETATVIVIHEEQLAEHGGPEGLRDAGLLESALARPQARAAYSDTDMAALAAAYAYGIVRNHPFVDGNKRTGWLAAVTFLALNGKAVEAPQADVVVAIETLANGSLDEAGFAAWLRDRLVAGG